MNKMLTTDEFLKDYEEYKKNIDIDKLRNFFDDIEINRNYFRLNLKNLRNLLIK